MASPRSRRQRAKQSRRRTKALVTNKEDLHGMLAWIVPAGTIFSAGRFHGNSKWTPLSLVYVALCWAWCETRNVTDAFEDGRLVCQTLLTVVPVSTYQGFMGALVTWTPALLPCLWRILQQRMEEIGGRWWRIEGWVPIAFDGSRSSAPRSQANEATLCAKNYGKGHTARYRKKKSKGMRRKRNQRNPAQPPKPQAWVTMLWHMGLRLPWCWRSGPSNACERQHVLDTVETAAFPSKTLFCGDAGFVGYPLWSGLINRGHDFLVRVGANVSLLTEQAPCQLVRSGKGIKVYCWPQTVMQSGKPPLVLRLEQVRLGKTKVWMLTSVLDERRLTTQAMIRFYRMRWGIEVEFRGLKQTLDRGKLRCRNGRRVLAELDWSILAMAVAELFALKEQLARKADAGGKKRRAGDPAKRSLAQTMRVLRQCMRNLNAAPAPGKDLASRLYEAVTDAYQRKRPKRARYKRPNPDKKPLGDPYLHPLTREHINNLKRVEAKIAA
jgi:hypothetical protein